MNTDLRKLSSEQIDTLRKEGKMVKLDFNNPDSIKKFFNSGIPEKSTKEVK